MKLLTFFLFTSSLLQVVLQWINLKLQSVRAKYKNIQRSELQDLNIIVFSAFYLSFNLTALFK